MLAVIFRLELHASLLLPVTCDCSYYVLVKVKIYNNIDVFMLSSLLLPVTWNVNFATCSQLDIFLAGRDCRKPSNSLKLSMGSVRVSMKFFPWYRLSVIIVEVSSP